MKCLLVFSLVAVLVSAGCRTPSNQDSGVLADNVRSGPKGKVWQQAVRQAQEEQRALQMTSLAADREIASMLNLTVGQHDPKTSTFATGLRAKNFLLVFNKDKNIVEDDKRGQKADWKNSDFKPDDDTPLYDKPIQFSFNANPVINCQQLIAGDNFRNVLSKEVFNRVPESDRSSQLCAYIKFSPVGSRPANRSIGDLAEANVYLTSDYRPYGLDVAVFKNKRESSRMLIQTDPDYSIGSSVDSIPYDLPNLHALSRMAAQGSSQVTIKEIQTITLPEDPYVQRKLTKAGFGQDPCSGKKAVQITYRDHMGLGKQVVSWCKGHVWPTMVENQKALTVLVPNQLR